MASTVAELMTIIRKRTGLSVADLSDDALEDILRDKIEDLEIYIEATYSIRLHEAIIKAETINEAMFVAATDSANIGLDYKLGDLEEKGAEKLRVAFKFIEGRKPYLESLYLRLEQWLHKKEEASTDTCYMSGIEEDIDVADDIERDAGFKSPERHGEGSTLFFW